MLLMRPALVQRSMGVAEGWQYDYACEMPFKHNASRRHHISKARRRITNWPAYEAGLQRGVDLPFWRDETVLSGWRAPRRTSRGGQPIYADIAIEVVLTMRLVFPLA